MANPELIRVMDFILNRCDEADIEAVAAAVQRRRRDLQIFGGAANLPDPGRWARDMAGQLNIDGAMEGLRKSVREFAIRTIKQEAPELSDAQIQELTDAWIPEAEPGGDDETAQAAPAQAPGTGQGGKKIPRDLLASMIEQFVSYSRGEMDEAEDDALRRDLGAWPERYWKAFPPVIRLIITDYLKDEIKEDEYRTRIGIAMGIK